MNYFKEASLRNMTLLGIGSAAIVSAAGVLLYQRVIPDKLERLNFEISPFLQNQSILLDSKEGTRVSIQDDIPRTDTEIQTQYDIFHRSELKYGNKRCFGWRQSFEDPVKWQTYNEVGQNIRALGAALFALSKTFQSNMVGIYSRNCPQWVTTMFSCSAYGLILVPLYETLGQQAMEHILQETQMNIAVCYTVEQAQQLIAATGSCIKAVIIINAKVEQLQAASSASQQNTIQWFNYDAFLREGTKHPVPFPVVNPSDLKSICYTSGSTGQPKGVMQTHQDSVLILKSLEKCAFPYFAAMKRKFVHLCHLPLAHGLEQQCVSLGIAEGAEFGFLTKDHSELLKDLSTYRPTYFVAVPRLLTRVYNQSTKLIRSNSILNRWLERTIETRMEEQKRGIFRTRGLIDWLFFNKLRDAMGGRIQLIISGSAPLDIETIRFLRVAMACPVIVGYGLTETQVTVTLTLPGECKHDNVGALSPGLQVKLIDVPDMNIIASRDHKGEIAVKTPANTTGYYKNEKKTKELFDSDGFLLTGDIGCWTPEGALQIVDRCKNIFKLAQGEYVSAEKVEQIYSESPLVTNVLVDGSSLQPFAVAVVVPDLKELRDSLLAKYASGSETIEQIPDFQNCSDKELIECKLAKKIVLENLNHIGRSKSLFGFEQAKALHLSLDAFTTENGLLTPSMKLCRPNARTYFAQALSKLYKDYELSNGLK